MAPLQSLCLGNEGHRKLSLEHHRGLRGHDKDTLVGQNLGMKLGAQAQTWAEGSKLRPEGRGRAGWGWRAECSSGQPARSNHRVRSGAGDFRFDPWELALTSRALLVEPVGPYKEAAGKEATC